MDATTVCLDTRRKTINITPSTHTAIPICDGRPVFLYYRFSSAIYPELMKLEPHYMPVAKPIPWPELWFIDLMSASKPRYHSFSVYWVTALRHSVNVGLSDSVARGETAEFQVFTKIFPNYNSILR